jgi:tetratricopeptide (TPR) repeat protein
MELVAGPTLRAWLKTAPSYRDKLRAFIAAGEGLAAAHRAELIHRDFKPDNVILGDDGRPRVLDFGLVRAVSAGAEGAAGSASPALTDSRDSVEPASENPGTVGKSLSDASGELSSPLTRVGAVLGTPRYMSPEQYLGLSVEAKSDQFGFCVALYEALYGAAPFKGKTLQVLRGNVCAGKVRPPPAGVRVPAPVRRAIFKGLASDADKRHASMEALLAELRRDPMATWRRAGIGLAFAALAATAVFGVARARAAASERCQVGSQALAGVWDGVAREAVRSAFVASGRSHAAPTFDRVAAVLDARADDWRTMRREACEATWVRGEQSEALLDLRMRCLDRSLQATNALVELFAKQPDVEVVDNAVQAVHRLPAIADCGDADALSLAEPLPSDPEVRGRIDALERALDEVSALAAAGKPRDALAQAETAAQAAERIGFRPLVGRALLELALRKSASGDASGAERVGRRALEAAATSHDDQTAARAAAAIVGFVGAGERDYDLALGLLPFAEALIARAGAPPLVLAELVNATGTIYMYQGNYDQALTAYQRALELRRQAVGDDNPLIAFALANIALVRTSQGDLAGAIDANREALERMERLLGSDHPRVGQLLTNLGIALYQQHKLGESQAALERSLAIARATSGSDHPSTATTASILGIVWLDQGRVADAIEIFEQALAVQRTYLGEEHPAVAETRTYFGRALLAGGQAARARAELEHAAASLTEAKADPVLVVGTRTQLGAALAETVGCARALPELEATLAVARDAGRAQHESAGRALYEIGRCRLELGRTAEARHALEQSLAIYQAAASASATIASVKFALARATWGETAEVRARAIALAREARTALAASEAARADELAAIDRWFVEHER